MTEIPVPKQFEKFIHAVSALQQAIDPASKPPVVSADETEVNLEFTDQLVIKGLSRVTAQVVDRALERNGLVGIDYSPTSQQNQEVTAILSYPGGNHPDAARLEKATKLVK